MIIQRLSALFVAFVVFALAPAAWASPIRFTGEFDPANWTLTLAASNGGVDVSGAPLFITVLGTDGYDDAVAGDTEYTITVPQDISLTFWWQYATHDRDGARYDPAGYVLNGGRIQLSGNQGGISQWGEVSLDLTAGDTFGFWVSSDDNLYGPAEMTVSGVPEPATVAVVGLGLLAIGFLRRKRA
ncbi:MAG TPA: PEP-CTERM sorting domain-containing protein [Bryobacteraceae bacterium]|nr:PEP-CTERM sorting domain-containing protein [Bryobacteraceae bacterium]